MLAPTVESGRRDPWNKGKLIGQKARGRRQGGGTVLEPGVIVAEIACGAPRLYLAAGVTTLRTTGSIEPYTDLKVRSRIEAGL